MSKLEFSIAMPTDGDSLTKSLFDLLKIFNRVDRQLVCRRIVASPRYRFFPAIPRMYIVFASS